jgi:hypothetical protein
MTNLFWWLCNTHAKKATTTTMGTGNKNNVSYDAAAGKKIMLLKSSFPLLKRRVVKSTLQNVMPERRRT